MQHEGLKPLNLNKDKSFELLLIFALDHKIMLVLRKDDV